MRLVGCARRSYGSHSTTLDRDAEALLARVLALATAAGGAGASSVESSVESLLEQGRSIDDAQALALAVSAED